MRRTHRFFQKAMGDVSLSVNVEFFFFTSIDMVVQACNASTWEAKAGGSPQVRGQLDLHSEF